MKVYVVVIDITYEYDNTISVKVFKERTRAERYIEKKFEELIADTNYDTIEREDWLLTAYNEGWFPENHCEISIVEKDVEE
jgi:hypothetical protein